MINFVQDFFFKLQTLHGLIVKNYIFSNAFHGINLLGFNMLTLEHFAKCSFTNYFDEFKVLKRCYFFAFFNILRIGWLFSYTILYLIHCIWVIFFNIFAFIITSILLSLPITIDIAKVNVFGLRSLLRWGFLFYQVKLEVPKIIRRVSVCSSFRILLCCSKSFEVFFRDIIHFQICFHFVCVSFDQKPNDYLASIKINVN